MNAAVSSPFVHLHLHSEFSLADGIVRIKPLAEKCAADGQPAVAITDLSNLYAVVKFYKACMSAGIKPIIGCDVWVENPITKEQYDRLTLLCKDNTGYRNLCKLLTKAYLRGSVNNRIVIHFEELVAHHVGLICFLDEVEGPLAREDSGPGGDTPESVRRYHDLFGDSLYFSISRVGRADEQPYINRAIRAAGEIGVGLVATNRVAYTDADDYEAHEIRVCINEGRVLDDSRRPLLRG